MNREALLFPLILAAAGCSSPDTGQQIERATSPSVAQDLDNYSQIVVRAAAQNIFNPSPAQKTGEMPTLSYVVKFHTSDPSLMSKDNGDTNDESYAYNIALNEAWSRRFCTPELKAIMAKHDVFMVSGHLLDAGGKMQTFVPCML